MRVRALDAEGDWEFGKGQNDYKTANKAVAQNLQTRLKSFLGNCFFDASAGIDWFTFLGGKDTLALQLAISAVILNTDNILGIIDLTTSLSTDRVFSLFYKVTTSFGIVIETVSLTEALTTQDGDPLTTEDGEGIII